MYNQKYTQGKSSKQGTTTYFAKKGDTHNKDNDAHSISDDQFDNLQDSSLRGAEKQVSDSPIAQKDFQVVSTQSRLVSDTRVSSMSPLAESSESKQSYQSERRGAGQADTDESTAVIVGGVASASDSHSLANKHASPVHQSQPTLAFAPRDQRALPHARAAASSDILDIDDIQFELTNAIDSTKAPGKTQPLFPKSLRQTAAQAMPSSLARNQILTGVAVMDSSFSAMNATFNFSSKFFKPSCFPSAGSVAAFKSKCASKEIPTCINWFIKSLRFEERVLICSTVDRDIVRLIQRMQIKCRENKNISLPEFLSVGFQFKPLSEHLFAPSHSELPSEQDGFDFKAGQKLDERPDVVDNELELLEYVRFTETLQELDTLTIMDDLTRDPERFIQICSIVVGSTFLRISPEFEVVNASKGRLRMKVPIWFQAQKYNSLAKWIIMFIERAVWIHYNAYVKVTRDLALLDIKKMWLQPQNQLVSFKTEILPYWTELSKKVMSEPQVTIQGLFLELEQKARQIISVAESAGAVNQFTGGLDQMPNQITSYDVLTALHQFRPKLNQLAMVSKPIEQMQFLNNLAQTKPYNLHDSIMVKLESLLAGILLAKQRQTLLERATDGTQSQNKQMLKKKLKKKQKQMLQSVEASIAKDKEIKRDREEAERQRIMYILAEREKSQATELERHQQENLWTARQPEWSSRVDTGSVRKADLDRLPTPVPLMQKGVSIKYVYPQMPHFVDSRKVTDQQYLSSQTDQSKSGTDSCGSSESLKSAEKACCSNEEFIQRKMDKMGPTYSQLLPNKKPNSKNVGYKDLMTELLHEVEDVQSAVPRKKSANKKQLPAMADYALSDDQASSLEESGSENNNNSSGPAEVIVELPERLAVTKQMINYPSMHLDLEYEAPLPEQEQEVEPVKLTKKQLKNQKVKAAKQQAQSEQQHQDIQIRAVVQASTEKAAEEEAPKSLLIIRPSLEKPKASKPVPSQPSAKATEPKKQLATPQKAPAPAPVKSANVLQFQPKAQKVEASGKAVIQSAKEQSKAASAASVPTKHSQSEQQPSKQKLLPKQSQAAGAQKQLIPTSAASNQQSSKAKQVSPPHYQTPKQFNLTQSSPFQARVQKAPVQSAAFNESSAGSPPKQAEESKKPKKKKKSGQNKDSMQNILQHSSFEDPSLDVFEQLLQQSRHSINETLLGTDQNLTDQLLSLIGQIKQQKQQQNAQSSPQPVAKNVLKAPESQQSNQPHVLSVVERQYHDMVSKQIKAQVKLFEQKLDSVRKEREHMILIIDRAIRSLFSSTSVKQYGSQANSLALDSSDVDLAVTGFNLQNHTSGQTGQYQLQQMNRLYLHLKQLKMLQNSEFIDTASVPVIKLRADLQSVQELMRQKARKELEEEHNSSDEEEVQVLPYVKLDTDMRILNIDITFDGIGSSPNYFYQQNSQENPQASGGSQMSLAISSVHKIKELQMLYIDLRSIVLIVKKLLAKFNLNKPYSGGLNSYSIVLMTSSFLQKFGINNVSALSQNLSEFFSFFGNYFDPGSLGMDGQHFFNLSLEQQSLQEHMWVLDIQNRENNTARTAFRINEIKQVFRNAYNTMLTELQRYEQATRQQGLLDSDARVSSQFEVIKKLLA